jgi:uncharacterized protein YbaR (Trm112 family)
MIDLDCPYCRSPQEIYYEGQAENEKNYTACTNCGMKYAYRLNISIECCEREEKEGEK